MSSDLEALLPRETRLTKYPVASLRELINLSLPLMLGLFSSCVMAFCNRLYLAHYSLNALEACAGAAYLCTLFQHPCMRITSMGQVFVGYFIGAGKLGRIGQSVWQMIWFSLISFIFTWPVSRWIGSSFFDGTSIQAGAMSYFTVMMYSNFLFPLGAALSSFFIGRGKTRIIFLTTLVSHACNVILDPILIFGIDGWISPQGVFGAAVSNSVSQALFCIILLGLFLRKDEREKYGTHAYEFHWKTFWEQVKVGLPRAITRIFILTSWVYTARIMTVKGGDFLLVLSVGSSLILLFTFIHDGMGQGIVTVASTLIGARDYKSIWKSVRSATVLLTCTTIFLAFPLIVFPGWTLSFFFAAPIDPHSLVVLKQACLWIWLYFFCYGYATVGLSLVIAGRDVHFYMFIALFVWLTTYLPAYFAFNYWGWSPDKLWGIMAVDSFIVGVLFLARASKEKWKEKALQFS